MIIVVEGISASGKTTWCQKHGEGILVEERYPVPRPDRNADPMKAANAWTDWNARRWAQALELEGRQGIAVCDTDPLKLHFVWSLWQIGEAPEEHWLHQLQATRKAFLKRVLGFADLYLVQRIDPSIAFQQRDADKERHRPNFDLHLRLQNSLHAWYEAISKTTPATVKWALPSELPLLVSSVTDHRYDVAVFDRFVASLPRSSH
ncbi:hypothetical protein [Sinorhizobium meliloti]|uniref:hypothetical protein n=1 Tax=Rhizobium meliloti TaxID=382 RepID=UPI000B4A1943|nr:hypothetical protein [Sinorhizobium meliloti]ASP87092.1 hypothetical protein CDO26_21450 [Sinorhizobium meliloti]MQW30948.1 hypothetical protein [Sinorhizobium meliloti]RVG85132.1 hypothetical protein CN219_12275 [Sinorhizobium meliloti]RVI34651.1 hypothetical protein CN197_15740 [Sinorhizobium meliloti]RVI49072.1 hypothetical protein CN196_02275 [Sinorhizobium meliloti]